MTEDDPLPPRRARRRKRRTPVIVTDFGGNSTSSPRRFHASRANSLTMECSENCRKPWLDTSAILARASAPRCPSCGALAFETRSSASSRRRAHDPSTTPEKREARNARLPYKCNRCASRFRTETALRLHRTENQHFASEIF